MGVEVKSAKFVKSAAKYEQAAEFMHFDQFAFVGRSNVGKSSLINMLTNRKNLAVTSSTPGRTRLINFFEIELKQDNHDDRKIFLVDLPGYGFAAASKGIQGAWNDEIGTFLTKTKHLKMVFVLMDIRHKPSDQDIHMLHYLQCASVAFSVLATKSDKLSRSQINTAATTLAQALGVGRDNIIATSADSRLGRAEVLSKISSM
jgi:GTP-binding protein